MGRIGFHACRPAQLGRMWQSLHLKASNLQVLLGGIGDGLFDLGVGRWQDHGDVPLPGLTQHLQPLAGDPIWQYLLQLITPACMTM